MMKCGPGGAFAFSRQYYLRRWILNGILKKLELCGRKINETKPRIENDLIN